MTESPLVDLGFFVPVFFPGDDPIACLNKAMAFLTAVASLRGNNASGQARVVKCYNCQDPGIPDGQAVQTIIPNNAAFYTEDFDTYDSNYDDISNEKAVLMANISIYGSDVISEKGQRINPTLYDGIVISEKYVAIPVIDDEETLILEEETPKELPKVSLVNESLKKHKFHLAKFDNVVKIRTTPDAHAEGEWGFEHTKAVFNNEIILFLKSLKDIFNVFDKDLLNEIMEVESSKTSDSNTPVLSPTRLKCSTSNCGSMPTCNKKNDRISQTPNRNMKNKLEAQPRKVNKKNRVVEPIRDVDVKQSQLNANSELICATCKKSMFDGVHDM
uniref:Uncharacterized protein n=1 Tax=Tanacetum cinerariifolium TaxID=118510 RepID=A0A6L2KCQ3_TANCI|nr:hypothetical protein [Tanacetum cinerariifolium]